MAILWAQVRQYVSVAEFKKGISIRVIYVVLQLADLIMTQFAINAGYEELNPVMRGLIGTPIQLVIFKLITPLAIAWLVPAKLLIPALVLLLVIIGFNVKELLLVLHL